MESKAPWFLWGNALAPGPGNKGEATFLFRNAIPFSKLTITPFGISVIEIWCLNQRDK
jgi:hypothetical protein